MEIGNICKGSLNLKFSPPVLEGINFRGLLSSRPCLLRCSYIPQVLTWDQVTHLLTHSHPLGSLHLESSPLEVGQPCRSVPEHSEHFTDSPSPPESLGGRGG